MDIILYVSNPTNFIASICALDNQHKSKPLNVTVLVCWPGASKKTVNEIAGTVKNLARPFPFVKKIFAITSREIFFCFFAVNAIRGYGKFRKKLGVDSIDEIYYPHDLDGGLCSIICSSFPQAKKICNGDGLGNVYDKKYFKDRVNTRKQLNHISFYANVKKAILSFIKKFFPPEVLDDSLQVQPDKAVLIMPVDLSGKFLHNLPFCICNKESVLGILKKIKYANYEFENYIAAISEKYKNNDKLILLTENYAESKSIDLEKEVGMYVQIITDNCKKGSMVFLKSHPGETLPRIELIKEKLDGDYSIVVADSRFKRFPIEIWGDFLCECKIACMSYPTLSLKYLYDIDVIQSLNDDFIEKWFPEKSWAYYKSHIDLYGQPLKNLAVWAGNCVLWAGNCVHGQE